MESKTCPKCRRGLPPSAYYTAPANPSGLSSYCQECCKTYAAARYVPRGPRPRPCQVCGSMFVGKGRANLCSAECKRVKDAARERPNRYRPGRTRYAHGTCELCGRTFDYAMGGQSQGRFCGRKCSAGARSKGKSVSVDFGPCLTCATVFCHRPGRRRYCSPECRYEKRLASLNDWYALACGLDVVAPTWRKRLIGFLVDRDGPVCQICQDARGPVQFDLVSGPNGDPSGLGPSIDHVVPVSKGGDNGVGNLTIAHWVCNRERKAAPRPTVQLALGVVA